MQRTAWRAGLGIAAVLCFGLTALFYATTRQRIPPFGDAEPVAGIIERVRFLEGDERSDNLVFRLADGQSFVYVEGHPKFRGLKQMVAPGATLRIWPWPHDEGLASFVQFEADGVTLLSYAEARHDNDERIRNSAISAKIAAAMGFGLAMALAVTIWWAPRQSAA